MSAAEAAWTAGERGDYTAVASGSGLGRVS
jgi:hypothetical protein